LAAYAPELRVAVRADGLAVAMRRAVVRDSQQRAGSWPAGRARMMSRRKASRGWHFGSGPKGDIGLLSPA
jgi:hypothetical protein